MVIPEISDWLRDVNIVPEIPDWLRDIHTVPEIPDWLRGVEESGWPASIDPLNDRRALFLTIVPNASCNIK